MYWKTLRAVGKWLLELPGNMYVYLFFAHFFALYMDCGVGINEVV